MLRLVPQRNTGPTAAVLLSVAALAAFTCPPSSAETGRLAAPAPGGRTLALVIGIDHYQNSKIAPVLKGAVADAKDLAQTLQKMGVSNLQLLLEDQANRAALEKAMATLEQEAKPGDLVIATYAGHGSREKELVPGSEPDGKDEFFVLWGFDSKGAGTAERIVDDQMFSWLERIAAKGAETIFLADSCYGGGMTKGMERRADGPSVRAIERVDQPEQATRGAYYIAPGEDRLPLLAGGSPDDDATNEVSTLTFISGVDDKHIAPEVGIDGQPTPRGAASFALARAFEGLADKEGDRDGATTRAELFSFLHRNVAHLSQNQQAPDTKPRTLDTSATVLFRTTSPAVAAQGKSGAGLEVAALPDKGAATVASPQPAKTPEPVPTGVIWDEASGNAIDYSGAVLAYGVAKTALPEVEHRVSAFRSLSRLASGRAIDTAVNPGDRNLKRGERFELEVGGLYGHNLILLNLAGDGTVQYLFPTGNAPPYMVKNELKIPMKVDEPFGTDTLVVIATSERQHDLEIELQALDQKQASGDLVEAIEKALGPNDKLGLATYTTEPR